MAPLRIGFVTAEHCPELTPDDRLAAQALESRGALVRPVIWSREARPAFDVLVLRSTWDYHKRAEEFAGWLEGLERSGIIVWNPVNVLRWNMDKRYLRDLERAGIPVTTTAWVEPGCGCLSQVLEERGWDEVVVKPCVSCNAWRTFRTNRARAGQDEAAFQQALSGGRAMVQPFVSMISEEGEWSLMYMGGRYTHAALKLPRQGGFLVQSEDGGSAEAAIPTSDMLHDAERALAAAPGPTMYARIDGFRQGRRFVVMELELLEPALFFKLRPQAAVEFADNLLKAVVTA
jgi:hypothetical protein